MIKTVGLYGPIHKEQSVSRVEEKLNKLKPLFGKLYSNPPKMEDFLPENQFPIEKLPP